VVVAAMRAARLMARGKLVCETVPAPALDDEPGRVLIRTELAAICGSDVHIIHHDLSAHEPPGPPGYPGHESVGEVVKCTGATELEGRRVLAVPPPADARSFAEYQVLSAEQVIPVPDGVPADQAILGQQLGTVLFSLKRFWPAGGARTVTIIGAGSAGLLFLQEVRRRGAERIVVSDLEPGRRVRAAELGADVVVDPRVLTAAEATQEVTEGQGAELVIEAAGYDQARADAVASVAVCGTVGCFGLPERPGAASIPFETLFRRRATVHLEHAAQEEPGCVSFRDALRRIEDGTIDVSGILTHRFALDDIAEAVELATQRRDGAIKVGIGFA
jgi:L-iditol 2-dehydrogenase